VQGNGKKQLKTLTFKLLGSLIVSGQRRIGSRIVLPGRHIEWQSLREAEVLSYRAERVEFARKRAAIKQQKSPKGFASRLWPPPFRITEGAGAAEGNPVFPTNIKSLWR